PDQGVDSLPVAGCTFNQWRAAQRDAPWAGLSDGDRQELAQLAENNFPSRPLYGRYLSWCFEQLRESLPSGVSLFNHATAAKRVARNHTQGWFGIDLLEGPKLHADQVVLAIGHVGSKLSPGQRGLHEDARQYGLTYLPPAVPNDVDWN